MEINIVIPFCELIEIRIATLEKHNHNALQYLGQLNTEQALALEAQIYERQTAIQAMRQSIGRQ